MERFLQKTLRDGWHSLRACWCCYDMLIALIGVKMGGRCRVYKFWRSQREVNYMEAIGEGKSTFWGSQKKVEYLKGSVRTGRR